MWTRQGSAGRAWLQGQLVGVGEGWSLEVRVRTVVVMERGGRGWMLEPVE